MIVIGILFSCMVAFEVRYLQQKNRKKRTFVRVLGTAVFLFICLEILYYVKEQWTVAKAVEMLFEPLENLLRIGQ